MKPKLLIGMATFDDFNGVYFTVQALRMYHDLAGVEIAVVDNNHASEHGRATRDFLTWVRDVPVHYVPLVGETGTAAPRNRIFELGDAENVLVLDPHVMLVPGAVQRLIEFYDGHFSDTDLYQGPMVYDDLQGYATHFEDVWGEDQMWGKWGQDPRGAGEEPFEIGAMGLGLFTCKRSEWLGFNPRFRGFGGEEWYIHEKYRKAARRVWCLPWLKWLHRFGRPDGVRYRLDIWDKARNYVIGLTELGIDLGRAKEAFAKRIKAEDWDRLVADPEYSPMKASCVNTADTLDGLFEQYKRAPRDLEQHADFLKELARKCGDVRAFVKRKEWEVFLAAGRPKSLYVHQRENDPLSDRVHALCEPARIVHRTYRAESLEAEPETTGLLVFDTDHQYERLKAELERHAHLATHVLVRATAVFGDRDEGSNGPGLLQAIKEFCAEYPEWKVAYHTDLQYGMTLITRVREDWPKVEVKPWPHGPGTELKRILAKLGVNPSPSCDCNAKAKQMDAWGIEGCKQRREDIAKELGDNAPRWGWQDKVKAAALAVKTGLAFRINPLNPFLSLVDMAIKEAEDAR